MTRIVKDKTRFHLDAELASAMFQKFLDKRQEAAVYICRPRFYRSRLIIERGVALTQTAMSTGDGKDVDKATEGDDLLYAGPTTPSKSDQKSQGCCSCTRKKLMILAIVVVMLLLYGIGLSIGLAIGLSRKNKGADGATTTATGPLPLGAVVSDHEACSQIGRDILMRFGTAVDAAIATLVCNGVRTPHSMGIGGGMFMVAYDKGTGKTLYFDGREQAPHRMSHDIFMEFKASKGCLMVMYDKGLASTLVVEGTAAAPYSMTHDTYKDMTNKHINARRIGVPGELKAYKMAYNKYGRLPWADLFRPTIKMLQDGFPMSEATAKASSLMEKRIKFTDFPMFCSVFCADETTGEGKKAGDMIYWPKMADTLQGVADNGPDYIYDSQLTYTLVEELKEIGGILEYRDFVMDYKPKLGPAYSVDLGNDNMLYTMPGASGGPVVAMITNILQGFNFTSANMASLKSKAAVYHKIIEAMKFTYADRANLEDPDFGNITEILDKMRSEDYAKEISSKITSGVHEERYYSNIAETFEDSMGTSHVSVISPYGDAVSVTSSINWYFGSCEMSNSTGILWNNEMDDFSTSEGVTVNKVEPGKKPRSSMAPVIIVNKRTGQVKLVIGAAGGARIANSLAQVIAKLLWLGVPLEEAMEEKRFQQTLNTNLTVEAGFPQDLANELAKKGHNVTYSTRSYMAVLETILVDGSGVIRGHADSRKLPGQTSYMYEYDSS